MLRFIALAVIALATQAYGQSCQADTCMNAGVCVIVLGNPSCACPPGVTGDRCQNAAVTTAPAADPCANAPCLNGGVCAPAGDIFSCTCAAGYIGSVCQLAGTNPPAVVPGNCPASSTKTQMGCGQKEIVFMIEYSRGDSYFDVDHEGDFIKRLIGEWNVNSNNVRVGIVTYHDTVREVIHIDDYENDSAGLVDRITSLTRQLRPSGTSNLGAAMEYARQNSFKDARPGVEKIIVPIVHSMPDSTKDGIPAAAVALKADCVNIIAMGVRGSRFGGSTAGTLDSALLTSQVVNSPSGDHYDEYSSFRDLEAAYRKYNDNNCS